MEGNLKKEIQDETGAILMEGNLKKEIQGTDGHVIKSDH